MPSSRISPGGTAITARPINVGNWPAATATSGTDTAIVAGTSFYTSVYIPGDMLITGVKVLLGSVSTNGTAIVAIYNENGTLLANSALAGTATTTAAQTQAINLTSPYTAAGPAYLVIAVSASSTSDKIRTVPAFCDAGSGILGGSQTGVYGTLPNPLTISATNFTADKAPVLSVY